MRGDQAASVANCRNSLTWGAALFLLLAAGFALDGTALSLVELFRHTPAAELIRQVVRPLGTGHVQIPVALLMMLAGALFSRRLKRTGGWALLAFIISGAIINIIKPLMHRPRPFTTEAPPDTWLGYLRDSQFQSFPSAEAATTFAVALTISAAYPRLRVPLAAVAIIVAAARVAVGSHHPSDIIAGAMIGIAVASLLVARVGAHRNAPVNAASDQPSQREQGIATVISVVAISGLVFLYGLGRLPLFGRDEALYAEAGREMIASGDWITPRVNGALFFEKPPLLYWLDAFAYSALGQTAFAARLPAALLGILTIGLTVSLVWRVWGRRAGLFAGMVLVTCPLVVMIGRMGIMDMPLTCLVTLAMLAYAQWRRKGGLTPAVAFGMLVGLALLLKGLAGGIAPAVALVHALVYRRTSPPIPLSARREGAITQNGDNEGGARGEIHKAGSSAVPFIGLVLISMLVVAAPWFIVMAMSHGQGYTGVFFVRENLVRMVRPMQGHGGPIFYYAGLIAFAFFPWVVFLPTSFARRENPTDDQNFWRGLALVWFLVVLIPLSLIKTKLPGYIMPLFPPMAMLVGVELDRRLRQPGRTVWITAIIAGVGLAAVFTMLPVFAVRLGERYGASSVAWSLVLPTAFWAGGYIASVMGGMRGLAGRPGEALAFMAGGQVMVVGALVIGVLPVLSPYLGGGPANLAEIAQRESPGRPIVLYETRPETVAFALRHPVSVFSHNEKAKLMAALRNGPTALIAPVKESGTWKLLPHGRLRRNGLDVLLNVPPLPKESAPGRETTG